MNKHTCLPILIIIFLHCNSFAQVTKTLSGTVTDDNGFKQTKFSTPNGSIELITTSDQGAANGTTLLTGTVSMSPNGETEKEKKQNLQQLQKYVLMVGTTKIQPSAGRQDFSYGLYPEH